VSSNVRHVADRTASKTGRRTQEVRREEAEQRILGSAAALVAERGLERFTLAEVSEAAGYSRGLPAHYFGNKEGLIEALAKDIVGGFRKAVEEGLEGHKPGLEHLLRTTEMYFERAERNETRIQALFVIFAESLHSQPLRKPISDLVAHSAVRMERDIRAGMAAGDIRKSVDPKAQAMLILSALRGAISQWLTDHNGVDLNALRSEFVATLRYGLLKTRSR